VVDRVNGGKVEIHVSNKGAAKTAGTFKVAFLLLI